MLVALETEFFFWFFDPLVLKFENFQSTFHLILISQYIVNLCQALAKEIVRSRKTLKQ